MYRPILFVFFLIFLIPSCVMGKKEICYSLNPNLKVIKNGWKGNPMIGNLFSNDSTIERYSFFQLMKWQFQTNPQKKEKDADTFRVEVLKTHEFVNSKKDMIVWLGHCSFFIRINGITLITDPTLDNMLFMKRFAGIPCPIEQITGLDYVLLSHNHRDHIDKKSLKAIFKANPKSKALIPLRTSSLIDSYTKNIEEAGWFQQYTTPSNIRIYFMPAKHWTRRGMFDFNKRLWGSFVIQTDSLTLFFTGDTRLGDHFAEIAALFPKIDYAFMPIGAYKPAYIMQRAHMSPTEAVEAANILKPEHFIPMHYGTYDLSDEPMGEPLRELKRLQIDGTYKGAVNVLKIGEELMIESTSKK
jgi:L-ascorbate metabolism protein UlaG (beta-lactamase superfamily)